MHDQYPNLYTKRTLIYRIKGLLCSFDQKYATAKEKNMFSPDTDSKKGYTENDKLTFLHFPYALYTTIRIPDPL